MISDKTFNFLRNIKNNNSRPWFEQNRSAYNLSHEEMISFAEELMHEMAKHDQLTAMSGKKSLYRIYRDVRFSKDKTPYKSFWGGRMKRDSDYLRGGYYYHIEPKNTFIAAGFWNPNADDIKLIRNHIMADDSDFRKIITNKKFKEIYGSLQGAQLKTAPKGIDKTHAAIDLLRYKQFVVYKHFSDQSVLTKSFARDCSNTFKIIRPFFDYMSYILTHDLNGESLLG